VIRPTPTNFAKPLDEASRRPTCSGHRHEATRTACRHYHFRAGPKREAVKRFKLNLTSSAGVLQHTAMPASAHRLLFHPPASVLEFPQFPTATY